MTDDNWGMDDAYATAASAKAGGGAMTPRRTKPTPQDMAELRSASSRAQAEREAQLEYASTRKAIEAMDTGPFKARMLDMVLPDQDGGILDTLGAYTIGLPARALISDATREARDQLNTVSAQTAMRGSHQMKGSLSDKDVALMRTAGISPYKYKKENLRILDGAQRSSELEQARNLGSGLIDQARR